jgi:hypothetical protein
MMTKCDAIQIIELSPRIFLSLTAKSIPLSLGYQSVPAITEIQNQNITAGHRGDALGSHDTSQLQTQTGVNDSYDYHQMASG